ncbi:hypothetical protein BBF96_01915 [Anoxybacter fermentans]|uniref:Teneurin-like YD-shell domain-containing protein n=2 Tax=Anoxybacter fermentans TaxID=1323375 RepID=A0A3Q9HNT6_9FIRM|nr:hypothetical protein BBF96_01915 [Anoxybacter fermentans]
MAMMLGLKIWEIGPDGALTEYGYDDIGRLVWIKYPDDTDTFTGTIGNLNPSYYSNRDDNLVELQIYDDINNVTTVANVVLGINTIESAIGKINSIVADIPEDSNLTIYNLNRYVYDGLNRWIELRQYLKHSELREIDGNIQSSPFITKFEYDRVGNRIKEIDAEGYVTFKEYDGLNRLTDIYYPDDVKYKAEPTAANYHLEIIYDHRENKRTIIDPEGNITEEIKDWNGNVVEVAKYDSETRYSSQAVYDRLGNQVRIVDAKGQCYDFVYDDWNQLIEKILPETEVILPGSSSITFYRPVIRYEYDELGRKTAEIMPNGNATSTLGDFRTDYIYDATGRVIKTVVNKYNENMVTKNYYDPVGNLIKTVDPEGRTVKKVYNPRGWVLAEIDPLNRITYHQYDQLGNEIAVTDPRGVVESFKANFDGIDVKILGTSYRLNPDYTTRFEYDSLSRQIKTIDVMGNTTEIWYDRVGNKRVEINKPGSYDSNSRPRITRYTYTSQYWLKSVIRGDDLKYKVEYEYDKAGNKIKEIYPDIQGMPSGSNYYKYEYDGLGRLVKVIRPDGSYERYGYDEIGNRTSVTNGRGYTTYYYYNGLNKLSEVIEPTGYSTRYWYDPNGNLVRKLMANGLSTDYIYNDLNLLVEEVKVRAGDVMSYKMAYDKTGNVIAASDPRGNITAISYYADGQIKEQVYYKPLCENYQLPDLSRITTDSVPAGYVEEERIIYNYDRAGNLIKVVDGLGSLSYTYDRLNQIIAETRTIDSNSYTTQYEYDFVGNIRKIKYPESSKWITYDYNELNQLISIGDIADDFAYDPAGNLIQMRFNNGVITAITPEIMSRPEQIAVKIPGENGTLEVALELNYAYDANGNVIRRNNNIYTYDELDRLKTAEIDGTFLVDTPARMGYAQDDYFINAVLDYELKDIEVDFDYAASTIGLKLSNLQKIGRIELIPGQIVDHRISKEGIRIFYRQHAGEEYEELLPDQWVFDKDATGKIIITLKSTITAGEIKIHSNYDDRDIVTGEAVNRVEFKGLLKEMVRVYGRYDRTKITYDYDAVGNRITETYTDVNNHYNVTYSYEYYSGSNRLKTRESQDVEGFAGLNGSYLDGLIRVGPGERMAYKYDKAGNLIAKGNTYTLSGDDVTYTATSGKRTVYWEYKYNSRNRLSEVWKNEEEIASYGYDYSGKRLKVVEGDKVTYYVYNYLDQVIFEDHRTEGKKISYIYAFGQLIAKVEGIVGSDAEVHYYHHDNLGSTMLMTDKEGKIVFEQDYAPFGQDLYKPGTIKRPTQKVEPGFKYTGQREEVNIGLYYYNARYYDPETGRFITEDTYSGNVINPQSQNLYIYVLQNPLKYVDPTGYMANLTAGTGGITSELTDKDIERLRKIVNDDDRLTAEEKLDLNDTFSNINRNLKKSNAQIIDHPDLARLTSLYLEGKISYDAYLIAYERVAGELKDKNIEWNADINWSALAEGTVILFSGVGQMVTGGGLILTPDATLITKGIGGYILVHGAFNFGQGLSTMGKAFSGGGEGFNLLRERYEKIFGLKGEIIYLTIDIGISLYGTVSAISEIREYYRLKKGGVLIKNVRYGFSEKILPFPGSLISKGKLIFNFAGLTNDIPAYRGAIGDLSYSLKNYLKEEEEDY